MQDDAFAPEIIAAVQTLDAVAERAQAGAPRLRLMTASEELDVIRAGVFWRDLAAKLVAEQAEAMRLSSEAMGVFDRHGNGGL